jgi:hypothetical protein
MNGFPILRWLILHRPVVPDLASPGVKAAERDASLHAKAKIMGVVYWSFLHVSATGEDLLDMETSFPQTQEARLCLDLEADTYGCSEPNLEMMIQAINLQLANERSRGPFDDSRVWVFPRFRSPVGSPVLSPCMTMPPTNCQVAQNSFVLYFSEPVVWRRPRRMGSCLLSTGTLRSGESLEAHRKR